LIKTSVSFNDRLLIGNGWVLFATYHHCDGQQEAGEYECQAPHALKLAIGIGNWNSLQGEGVGAKKKPVE
jgi:hypothetical protein